MKKTISIILSLSILISIISVAFGLSVSASGDVLTDEQLEAKNLPVPKDYVVSQIYTFDDSGSSDDGCYYDKASSKVITASNDSYTNFLPEGVRLDGAGFMFWYKTESGGTLRIRDSKNALILEATLPACTEGKWVKYWYYGKNWENISPKTDAKKDISEEVSDQTNTFKFTFHNWSSTEPAYFDEFYTFTPQITPADTYDNDKQAYKFSVARMSEQTNTVAEYSDDGSVELTSTYGETTNSSPVNITYKADSEQFKKAVDIAKQGSGYLQIKVDNISSLNSSDNDAYTNIIINFNGIDKKISKYSYGSNTSDTYLLKVDDLDTPEAITTINVLIKGSNIKNVDFRFSPITVFEYNSDEIILEAEDLNPKHKKSDGTIEDAIVYVEDDQNLTYVHGETRDSWVSFDLPELEVGEYEVYANCSAVANSSATANVSINNLRQLVDVSFADATYTSKRHNINVPIGNLKITKNFSDGASVLKLSSRQNSYLDNIYINYFSFKKTDTVVAAEPSSNFVIKSYPEKENYEIKTIINTFDDYICGTDIRYYKDTEIAGYVGDDNAYNLNSRGTMGWGGDSNYITSVSGGLDGDALRFWLKSTSRTELRFSGSGVNRISYYIPASPSGSWIVIDYTELKSDGDMSAYNSISLKEGGTSYIDEIHTIQKKIGNITYTENSDGTASVGGYELRIEEVVVDSQYNNKPVTSIKAGALANTLNLKSVVLADSVTTIEEGAFENDRNLKTIEFGSGLTTIGANAFKNCTSLGEVEFSSNVTSIDDTAFEGCTNLIMSVPDNSYAKEYAIRNNINYRCSNGVFDYYRIGDEIHINKYLGTDNNVTVPETIDDCPVTTILSGAFKDNTDVTSVTTTTIKKVESEAFSGCTALKTVDISGVEELGSEAFSGCTALTEINLGESITTIGEKAFCDVTALPKIKLPESLTSIASNAFENCLDTVIADVVRDSYAYTFVNSKGTAMTQIPDTESEFKYSLYKYEATIIGYTGTATKINIPDTIDGYTVVAIGEGAFKNNTSLTYVKFSDKCKTINKEAFSGCTALKDFDINNVITIKELAFSNCTSLSDITLTNIVKYESNAFSGCKINITIKETQFARTALELTNSWHAGINLGNRFDWSLDRSNPVYVPKESRTYKIPTVITKQRIDFLADSGFDVIRFPITWLGYTDDSNNYKIDDEYLQAVKEIVDYAIADDLYIIINVHHDTLYWLNLSNYSEETCRKFERIWEQISDYFKDYDEHLIFESMNEERYNESWDGNEKDLNLHQKFNDLQKRFYNVVRNSGGNNAMRYLMFETYAAQAKAGHCQSVWVPSVDEDSHIMMSVHHYDGRAGAGYNNTQYSYGQKYFVDYGIPYVIGETGSQRVNLYDTNHPVSEDTYNWQSDFLVEWTNGVLEAAENYGHKIIFWEDGGSFGMINHNELKWDFPAEVDAIMEKVYPKEDYSVTVDGVIIDSSSGSVTLPENTDVEFVAYSDGKKLYKSGETVSLTENLTLFSVKVDLSNREYTGLEITTTLSSEISSDSFILEYTNNTNVGTATVKIATKEDPANEISKTFQIVKTSFSEENFQTIDTADKIYTGKEIKPEVISTELDADSYEVSYKDNINAGTATIIITGKGNYEGNIITKTFKIVPKAISETDFSVNTADKTYTGSAVKTTISSVLTKDVDYEVVYTDNIEVGTATVTISGKGNYQGTIIKKFNIVPKATITITEADFRVNTDDKTYTGSEIITTISSSLTKNVDYEVVYTNNIEVGTATVTISGKGNYTGTIIKTFRIVSNLVPPVIIPDNPQNNTSDNANNKLSDASKLPVIIQLPNVAKVKKVSAKTGTKKLTVKWKKVSGADGYKIQVSLNKSFKKSTKTIYVKGSKKIKTVIKKLKANKKYFVRIAAYKNYKNDLGKVTKAVGKYTKFKKAVKTK
ncbi:MAG: leucine-rich repeat protein [Acutalibacteraceae bacterium]